MSLLLVRACFVSFVHFNSFLNPPLRQDLSIYCGVFRKIFTVGKKVLNKICISLEYMWYLNKQ
jgi:hypothetical protein